MFVCYVCVFVCLYVFECVCKDYGIRVVVCVRV